MKHALLIPTALVCFAFAVAAKTARADRTDFMVNDDGTVAEQTQPRVAVSSNCFIVVWSDARNGNSDIYYQRFSSVGAAIGQNQRVNDDTTSAHQAGPAVGVDYAGHYTTVWQDYRYGTYPFDPEILSQRFDTNAAFLSTNARLTLELPDSLKENPDIALAPWGDGVVVWADYRNRNWDIYGQRISANGALLGVNFRVNDDLATAQQHAPRVAVSPDGWFVVTWYDNRSGNDDIYAQRFDSSGTRFGPNIRVSSDGTNARQAFPDVAADAMGHFTMVWTDWRNGVYPANPDIYARKYDTILTPLYSDRKVNFDVNARPQRDPSIAADRMGNVAILWADSTSSSWDIVGQMIDVDGVVRETNFRANSSGDSAQLQPDVALDGRYRYAVWTDRRSGQYDIFASITTYNTPRLIAAPASLAFRMSPGGALPTSARVALNHGGYNSLHFQVTAAASWLSVSPTSGATPDTLTVSVVDQSMAEGTYIADITLIDTDRADSSQAVPVRLEVSSESPLQNSIAITSAEVRPGTVRSVPITLTLVTSIQSIVLPLKWDSTVISVDSIQFDTSMPATALMEWLPDTVPGQAIIRMFANGTALSVGTHVLGELFFTAGQLVGVSPIDTTSIGTGHLEIITAEGQSLVPWFERGTVTVSLPTSADDPTETGLPQEYTLGQNYPNPFNSSTVIQYSLPRRSSVTLEIFNILGQRVATLAVGTQAAGQYRASWSGESAAGRLLTSGIYFYRLEAADVSLVRKMVLIK
ncbi:MAG: T9SS type A sorting domain-containing protein [Candidatus Zixiibacteriota bacterium]